MDNSQHRVPDNKGGKRYLFDDPKNVQRLLRTLYSVCVVLVVLDFMVDRHHYHAWEQLPAFYAVYGFAGCVVLVLVAKWMRTWLMRPEDYYERPVDD